MVSQSMVLDVVRSEKPLIFLATTPLPIGVGALYVKLISFEVTISIILCEDNFYDYLKHVDDSKKTCLLCQLHEIALTYSNFNIVYTL